MFEIGVERERDTEVFVPVVHAVSEIIRTASRTPREYLVPSELRRVAVWTELVHTSPSAAGKAKSNSALPADEQMQAAPCASKVHVLTLSAEVASAHRKLLRPASV